MNEMVKVLDHAFEASAFSEFNFKANDEIQGQQQVIGALHGEHLL